jgi:alpha-beta hydrolase superfamily lysophospholipase
MANFQTQDGTTLHEKLWNAAGSPIGTVVLVHGYGEHIGRYEHVGQALSAGGFHVRGFDLRGHGQSGGARGYCERFVEYLDDLSQVVRRAREGQEALPLFLVGHSFGALISFRFCIERPQGIAGVMLSSPYFALKMHVPKVKLIAGQITSMIYGKMSLPSGLKGTDVSHDPQIIANYDKDPLNNKSATARWFTETSETQAWVLANASRFTLPLLLLAGAADPIADPQRAQEVFERVGSSDKQIALLSGQLHEIFNELEADRKETLQRVVSWLKAHASAESGKLRARGA